jgi:hypothetical protein
MQRIDKTWVIGSACIYGRELDLGKSAGELGEPVEGIIHLFDFQIRTRTPGFAAELDNARQADSLELSQQPGGTGTVRCGPLRSRIKSSAKRKGAWYLQS